MTTYTTSNSPFLPKTGKKPSFIQLAILYHMTLGKWIWIPSSKGGRDPSTAFMPRRWPDQKKKKKKMRVPLLRSTGERSLKNGLTASSEHWGLRAWLPSCHQAEQETNTLWRPHPNQRTSGTLPHHTQGTASLRDPCVTEWMSLHKPTWHDLRQGFLLPAAESVKRSWNGMHPCTVQVYVF